VKELVLPEGMDGFGVWPKFSAVARESQAPEDWPIFNRAMHRFIQVMNGARSDFMNRLKDRIGPDHLRLHPKTQAAYQRLEQSQPGDLLVAPVQTGLLYRGKSPRRALALMRENEFGIDPFALGCLTLTHPDRLTQDSLWADCPGAKCRPDAGRGFTGVPYWIFYDGRLRLDWLWHDCRLAHFGSVSGLLTE